MNKEELVQHLVGRIIDDPHVQAYMNEYMHQEYHDLSVGAASDQVLGVPASISYWAIRTNMLHHILGLVAASLYHPRG